MSYVILGFLAVTLAKIINVFDNHASRGFGSMTPIEAAMKRGRIHNLSVIVIQIHLCIMGPILGMYHSLISSGILLLYGFLVMKSLRFNLPRGYLGFIR